MPRLNGQKTGILTALVFLLPIADLVAAAPRSLMEVRRFVFMDAADACADPHSPQCYLNHPQAAEAVVTELGSLGFNSFLIPSATSSQVEMLGGVIRKHGFQFFTYERWSWESAMKDGVFSCEEFRSKRLDGELRALKRRMGDAFGGIHLKDEPSLTHLDNLKGMRECLRNDPDFSGTPVFLNLLPLEANSDAIQGTDPSGQLAGLQKPHEYGVDCSLGRIADPSLLKAKVQAYTRYVELAADKVAPDFLAFDFYPFSRPLAECKVAMETLLSENLNIVSSMARARGLVPVAYHQNRTSISIDGKGYYFKASFQHLRWFSSWASSFGIQAFASFISHDFRSGGDPMEGLLNRFNQPTGLAEEYRDYHAFRALIDRELSGYAFRRFVAPFLGVKDGDILGWVPSDQVLAGEYRSTDGSGRQLLFVSRRDVDRPLSEITVSLKRWYKGIEVFDPTSGRWQPLAAPANQVTFSLSAYPGAMIRLTP